MSDEQNKRPMTRRMIRVLKLAIEGAIVVAELGDAAVRILGWLGFM